MLRSSDEDCAGNKGFLQIVKENNEQEEAGGAFLTDKINLQDEQVDPETSPEKE